MYAWQAVQRSYFFGLILFFLLFLPNAVNYWYGVCITCTIIKVNILHDISPNLGHNIISLYKIYTLSNWCSSQ